MEFLEFQVYLRTFCQFLVKLQLLACNFTAKRASITDVLREYLNT